MKAVPQQTEWRGGIEAEEAGAEDGGHHLHGSAVMRKSSSGDQQAFVAGRTGVKKLLERIFIKPALGSPWWLGKMILSYDKKWICYQRTYNSVMTSQRFCLLSIRHVGHGRAYRRSPWRLISSLDTVLGSLFWLQCKCEFLVFNQDSHNITLVGACDDLQSEKSEFKSQPHSLRNVAQENAVNLEVILSFFICKWGE